jgi:catechol 2,3-dioxygenase-like lactoylglutathione lyase family enzyme
MMMQSHISLYVSSLEASLRFYTAFLGLSPSKVKAKYAKFNLQDPLLVLSLVENPERAQGGFGHLGIVVDNTQAVKDWMKQAQARGTEIVLVEEGARCCYAKQDKFWVKDPDGVQWEIYTFHEDSEWNDPEYPHSLSKD